MAFLNFIFPIQVKSTLTLSSAFKLLCGCDSVASLNQTSILHWCEVRWGSKNTHHKKTCVWQRLDYDSTFYSLLHAQQWTQLEGSMESVNESTIQHASRLIIINITKACLMISVWYLAMLRHRWICQCDAKFHRVDLIDRSRRTWKTDWITPAYLTPCSWASHGWLHFDLLFIESFVFQFPDEHQSKQLEQFGTHLCHVSHVGSILRRAKLPYPLWPCYGSTQLVWGHSRGDNSPLLKHLLQSHFWYKFLMKLMICSFTNRRDHARKGGVERNL